MNDRITDLAYKPIIYKINSLNDEIEFSKWLEKNSQIEVLDTIEHQLKELIKIKNVKKPLSETEINKQIERILNGSEQKYGVWVYYPWRKSVVHLLDENDFITVRTNRNKLKITQKEQEKLATKKIGVVGLSVGQSVALTLAMERDFGELRIADFDTIDLSNLNRIRTGVHHLNVPKTIVVAREIAEIDPFLKVTLFNEGLTEQNMSEFLDDLNVLIDECDSLDLKILMRDKAKKMKIPVLMDTSDKGLLDVERFDLNPNLPLLHGLVGNLNVENIKDLTNKEKIPYALQMVGGDAITERLKISMGKIGDELLTWPQLAADVVAGGGHTAAVCRKICLGENVESGRYYIFF